MVIVMDNPDANSGEHPADHRDQRQRPPEYSGAAGAEQHGAPPPFPGFGGPSTFGPPPPATTSALLSRPTNYLTVERENSSIRATYSINPALPALPGVIKPQGRDGKYLNLKLLCQRGNMLAIVDIVRSPGSNTKEPARLEAANYYGTMDITLYNRLEGPFHLRAIARNSTTTIHIPPTFAGIITASSQHSMFQFDIGVQRRLTTISERPYERRYFMGDFAAYGYDEEAQNMDRLDIEAEYSTVSVRFSGNPGSYDGSGVFDSGGFGNQFSGFGSQFSGFGNQFSGFGNQFSGFGSQFSGTFM